MPFVSKQQKKFMYSQHPKLAREFELKTKGKLPNKKRSQAEAIKRKIK